MEEVQNQNTQPEVNSAQKESDLLTWQANEFKFYEHNWKWYLLVAIASLAVIGYSIYMRDWFIIGIVVVVLVFIFINERKKPSVVDYRITQLGLYCGDHLYPYSEIHSFWLSLHDKEKKLNIIFSKKYLPQLSIILEGIDPLQIRTTLGKYLPEQENRTDSIIDVLSRLLKL